MNKKIVFFGTPAFTTDFLDKLLESGYAPTLVVTGPDRPAGRGMNMQSPAPKVWADKQKVTVLQPEKLDEEFFAELSKETWDLFVVVAYGKIIPEQIINLPQYGTINIHYSLLPKYRGATPVESAILNGDSVTGVCIQEMRFKLDTGPILAQQEVPLEPTDTTPTLRDKLNDVALALLPKTIAKIFDVTIAKTEQNETEATHCSKIKKEDGELDLADDAQTNNRKYRAYAGSIGTYFFKDGKRIKITKAHFENGSFVIDEVIPENGKRMPWKKN